MNPLLGLPLGHRETYLYLKLIIKIIINPPYYIFWKKKNTQDSDRHFEKVLFLGKCQVKHSRSRRVCIGIPYLAPWHISEVINFKSRNLFWESIISLNKGQVFFSESSCILQHWVSANGRSLVLSNALCVIMTLSSRSEWFWDVRLNVWIGNVQEWLSYFIIEIKFIDSE